jgi:hypothetical protein
MEAKKVTFDSLNKHLHRPMKASGLFKQQAPVIRCPNGAKFSVQASRTHYCSPQNDVGPYHSVEVGYPYWGQADQPEWWTTEDVVEGYVDIFRVIEFINESGGMLVQS